MRRECNKHYSLRDMDGIKDLIRNLLTGLGFANP